MKIQAVLYDMDGTLLDTEKLHKMAWTQCAAQRGSSSAPSFTRARWAATSSAFSPCCASSIRTSATRRPSTRRRRRSARAWMDEHGVPVLPGAHEALGALGARGVRQCVCTSTSRDSAERTLAAAGLLPKIDALVCGDDIERSKPDPQIFLRGAQKLGVPIERCAVVEDAPAGIAAGLASGARVFCVPGLLEIPAADLARCTRIGSLWELADRI